MDQPRKSRPCLTETLLMGCKESNQANKQKQSHLVGSMVVRSLLQLSERWPCDIWPVGRMKFVTLEANLSGSGVLLVYHILLFSLPLSGRSPESDITEILLTGTFNLNSN